MFALGRCFTQGPWSNSMRTQAGVNALLAACSKTARTCSGATPGNHSTNCAVEAPSSRFSKRAATGTRVPRNIHAPLTRSGSRSTAGQEDQSIMRESYHRRSETANGMQSVERLPLLRLQLLAIEHRAPYVDFGVLQHLFFFLRLQLPHDFAGRADYEHSIGIRFAFGDERAVADGTAVQHCFMADRYISAEREGNARIDVQDRGVLDVGTLADGNGVVVPADDCVEPNARLVAQDHRADHGGVVRYEPLVAVECDFALAEGEDRHGGVSWAGLRCRQ